jgi:hypothetical protein
MSTVITDIGQVTPVWLTHLLRRKGYLPKSTINDIHILKLARTNVSTIYYLAVSYSSPEISAPARLFLKLPNPDFVWPHKEVEFYNRIVPAMQLHYTDRELPFLHCYDAVYIAETGQSYLLMEDLSQTHFTIDRPMPPTVQHCERLIDAYALFHAHWWEHPRLGRDIGERLTEEGIDNFLKEAQKKFRDFTDFMGESLSKPQCTLLEGIVSAWPEKRRQRLAQGKGITLVHRDPHPLNFLYPDDLAEGEVKLIDWQSWRIDTGSDDLAYLMACHWPFEQRVQLEAALLRRYFDRLLSLGVNNYRWDDCYYDYQASIIRCLFFLMYAWSPAQWQAGAWWGRLQKGLAAFKGWNCADLLLAC